LAKNLKITVKNAQLAEALKKFKKPEPKEAQKEVPKELKPAPKKGKAPREEKEEPIVAAPVTPPEPPAPKPRELPEATFEKETPAPEKEAEKPPEKPPERPLGPRLDRPVHKPSGDRPAYKPSGYRPGGAPRTFSDGPRPAYQPRQAGAPAPGAAPQTGGYHGSGGYRPKPAASAGVPEGYKPRPPGSPPYQPGAGGYRPRPPGGAGGYRPYTTGRPPGAGGAGGFGRRPPPPMDSRAGAKPSSREHAPAKSREEDAARKFKDVKDIKAHKKPEVYRAFDSRDKQGLRDENDEGWRPRKGRGHRRMSSSAEELIVRPKSLKVRVPITIKELAVEMKLKASQLLSNLFMKGVVITLNDFIDDETTIQLLGHDFDCEITIDTSEEERLKITDKTIKQEISETPPDELVLRSPVVTFMGHVDHGKTSLIDTIRKANVASGEAGAITQHIGAFKAHTAVGDITILDTPGHEAFSAMRARGADVTDIVVLVVAGDEGLRAQTMEAIEQARTANVPIVVAINKCDKPNFNSENVFRQLSEINLLPEAWGGQTITINCSAVTGEGIKELLEMLALQAEILELKANPNARARGAVIESEMHKGLGAVTTVLVQNGTLRIGDAVVFASHWGRIKTMQNEFNKPMTVAGPSSPVKLTGLSGLPEAGSDFIVVKDEKEASEVSEERLLKKKHTALQVKRGGLENLLAQTMEKQVKKVLTLILRADVQGSLEALKHSLEKIASTKAEINVISAAVGEISESDIQLAFASKGTLIGFHTQVESHAESLIKQLKVKVRLHDIIYHAVDDVKELMVGLLDKIAQEHDVGEAEVKAIFKSSHLGNIAGCQVSDGIIRRNSHIRVVRDKEVIWKGPVASLKRVKEDVREVSKGQECGILLQGFTDCKAGDLLQAYDVTYYTPEL
jgi:translation initiation factor IF-2